MRNLILQKLAEKFEGLGRHNNVPLSKLNKGQKVEASEVEKGQKVEREHIDPKKVPEQDAKQLAVRIAKDHLAESPDYYKHLKNMEASMDKAAMLIKKQIIHKLGN